ncbi:hypothetical protein EON65_07865 [archaeon]|nr:MAG: hypothetical protein EON65_07865 [archaeon]
MLRLWSLLVLLWVCHFQFYVGEAQNVSPELTGVYYDAGSGNLTLTFSTLVTAETLNITGLVLQNGPDHLPSTYSRLSLNGVYNSLKIQGNTTSLRIILKSIDYARLTVSQALWKSLNSTYIALNEGSILSNLGQSNVIVPTTSAVQAVEYQPDILPPFFSYYHINIDSGLFNITFSEPIDLSTFTLVGLAFQGSPNMKVVPDIDRRYYALVDDGSRILNLINYNRTVVANIGVVNLNGIKRQLGMCITRESCFLSAYKPFVSDLSNNSLSLVAFDMLHGVLPVSYVPDLSNPFLLYWDFNATTNIVVMTFSETLYMSFFNFSGITLTNNQGSSFRLQDPIGVPIEPTHAVQFSLSEAQFFLMQQYNNFFTALNNTFLVLDQGIVVDTSADQNKYVSSTATLLNPMRVRTFYRDVIDPQLTAFELDMPNATLTFFFSKTVRIDSMQIQFLVFQSDENQISTDTELIVLSSVDVQVKTITDAPVVAVKLLASGLQKFYNSLYLGRSVETTFISVRRYFITDKANPANEIVQISTARALKARNVVPDRRKPSMIYWRADMDTNVLTLNFTRPVLLQSVDLSSVFLTSDLTVLKSTKRLSISDSELQKAEGASTSVILKLSASSQIAIKSYTDLCVSTDTCFLSFLETFAKSAETYEEVNDFVEPVSSVGCDDLYADQTQPLLLSFGIDMNTADVALTFSKSVISRAANFSQLRFFADSDFSCSTQIAASSFSTVDDVISRSLVVTLSHRDFINLQLAEPIGKDANTTFAGVENGFVTDVYRNVAVSGSFPLPATQFVQDNTPPKLIATYLDSFLAHNVTLAFSEVVLSASVNTSCLAIASRTGRVVSLSGAVVVGPSRRTAEVVVSVQSIKSRLNSLNVATNQANTFIYVAADGCLLDASRNRNPIEAMTFGSALRIGQNVLSFRLDLLEGFIDLELVLSVGVSKVNPGSITVISAMTSGISYRLSGMVAYELLGGNSVVRIHLFQQDIIAIRRSFVLDSKNSILISLLADAVLDNNRLDLSASVIVPCAQLRVDMSMLVSSYTVDLSLGLLTFIFSNDIIVSTYNNSETLQFALSPSVAAVVTLKNASVFRTSSSPYDSVLTLNLNNGYPITDREAILLNYPLGNATNTLFLLATKGFVFSNTVPSQPSARVHYIPPVSIVQDSIKPTLVAFAFDLSQRILTLNFSEAVNVASIQMNRVRILRNPTEPFGASLLLSSSSVPLSYAASPSVKISLSAHDVDEMMLLAPDLALTAETTFISCLSKAFSDLSSPGNFNNELFFRYGLPVSQYTADKVPPKLISFNISITDGTLDMLFDEVVSCHSFDPTKLLIQARQFMGIYNGDFVLLSGSSYCIGIDYLQTLHVVIGYDDIVKMKRNSFVLNSHDSSFLRLLTGAIQDAAGNGNEELPDGFAVSPIIFNPDTKPPRLLSFSITNIRTIVLYFSEPIDISTLRSTRLKLLDDMVSPIMTYHLMETSYYRSDANMMRIEMNLLGDYYRIITDSRIFGSQATTFLQVETNLVKDTAGNFNVPVIVPQALRVGPRLINWDLDMDAALVTLVFSEPVAATFSLLGCGIQNAEDVSDATNSFVFSTSTVVTQHGVAAYRVLLDSAEMNLLKQSGLIPQPSNLLPLYMYVIDAITTSTAPDDLIAPLESNIVRNTESHPVRYFWPDTTPPTCLTFDLDLNFGLLTLMFDEPVLPGSLMTQGIILFSRANGSFITLSRDGFVATLVNDVNLQVALNPSDTNKLKLEFYEGGILDSLIITAGSLVDMNGNKIVGNNADTPISINQYTADSTPPVAAAMDVDLSRYIITVLFDEIIDVSYFGSTGFVLLNNATVASSTKALQLSNFTLLSTDPDQLNLLYIDIGFLREDQFALEAINDMYNSELDSYLAILQGGDVFGNQISSAIVIQALTFRGRNSQVQLESFDMEDSSATVINLTLYFDAVMDISAFHCSDFLLLSSAANSAEQVSFADSDCTLISSADSRVVLLTFLKSKLTGITIFSARSSTYLGTIMAPVSIDVYGNTIRTVSGSSAIQLGPQVVRASLDLNDGIALLVFSKDIDIASLSSVGSIGFYSTTSNRARSYFLDGDNTIAESYGGLSGYKNAVVYLSIDHRDLDNMKVLDAQPFSTYLLLSATSFQDSLNYNVYERSTVNALRIDRLIEDKRRPVVVNASLDMSMEIIKLYFSEPIRSKSIVLSSITLQSAANNTLGSTLSYRLTGGTIAASLNLITIELAQVDASAIKLNTGLGDDLSTSYFSILFGSMADFGGNYLPSIAASSARQFDAYVVDTFRPVLKNFRLDLSQEIAVLTLYFSEPVQVSLMNVTSIVLQSRYASRDGASFRLTGGTIISPDSDTVLIEILHSDFIAMKLIPGLIRRKQSTYIVFGTDLAMDLLSNSIIDIPDGRAKACSSYIADTTPPIVQNVLIDMNLDRITILFDEPVNLTSIDPSALTILTAQVNDIAPLLATQYSLTQTSSVLGANGDQLSMTVVIQLSRYDADQISNRAPLAISLATSFISFTPALGTDFVGNNASPIVPANAVQVSAYVADTTQSVVDNFVLDMNQGTVALTLSKAITLSSLNLTEIKLQAVGNRRFGAYVDLDSAHPELSITVNETLLTLSLSQSIVKELKFKGIGQTEETSYLAWTQHFAKDTAGNILTPAFDGSIFGRYILIIALSINLLVFTLHFILGATPRALDVLIRDNRAPIITKFFVDRSSMTLLLVFDEPVVVVNATQITLRAQRSNVMYNFPLLNIISPQYAEQATRIAFKLVNYCHDSPNAFLQPGQVCNVSSPALFSLLMDNTVSWSLLVQSSFVAVEDYAQPANALSSILSYSEGAPGKF